MIRPLTVIGCNIRTPDNVVGEVYQSGEVALCTRCNGVGFFNITVDLDRNVFPWIHQRTAKRKAEALLRAITEGLTFYRGPMWGHRCTKRSKHVITKKAVKK